MLRKRFFKSGILLSIIIGIALYQRPLLAQPYNPPKSSSSGGSSGGGSYNPAGQDLSAGLSTATSSVTGRSLASRAADTYNPKDFGAVGNYNSHPVGTTLGVTSLTGLASYSSAYSWVTNSTYGLTFPLSTNVGQSGSSNIIAYTPPSTAGGLSGPTATAYNYQNEADYVLAGMNVTGSCIASGTTVSAVATGLPFSITTSLPSSAGSSTIILPFIGGITVGETVQASASGVPSGATVTAVNAAGASQTAYVSITAGSTTVTYLGAGTMPTSANIGAALYPELRGDSGSDVLMFPPFTTITGIIDSSHFTVSNPAIFTGSNYLPLAYNTPPSITISSTLSATLPARTSIYFGGISQVTLSQPTSSACGANTTLTYSYSNSMVQALEMDWLGIQSAVVAAAGSVAGGGQVKIPAGSYKLSRMVALPNAGNPESMWITGDGILDTVLTAQQDTGRGTCAMGENNRSTGALSADYTGFQLAFINTPYAVGLEPSKMSGLCMGEGSQAAEVDTRSFHAGYDLLNDHQKILRSTADYNWFGVEMAANSASGGNQDFENNEFLAQGLASIAAAWNFGIDSSIITNTHTGFSPYGYYREGAPYGQSSSSSFLTNTQLNNVGGEALGNGWMYGENGVSDIIEHNVFIETSPSIDPGRGYNIPTQGLYGVFVAGQFEYNTFLSSNIAMNNGGGATNYTFLTCALICMPAPNALIGTNRWADSTASNDMITGPNVTTQNWTSAPIWVAQFASNNVWSNDNASGSLVNTTSAVTAGQVMAYTYAYYAANAAPYSSGAVARGVAVNAAAANGVVAITEQGLASVNATNYASSASPAYISTTTPTSVTTATSSDANTAVRIGVFMAGNQIVVRLSP